MGTLPCTRIAASLALALSLGGCGSAQEPGAGLRERMPPRAAKVPDKAQLYADARLLPDRAGERARRELALAGELRAHLGQLAPGASPAQVTVELGPPARVLVTAPAATLDRRDAVEAIVIAAVPDAELVMVPAGAGPGPHTAAMPAAPALSWALALVWLAFGVSLGVTLERLRGRSPSRRPARGSLVAWGGRGAPRLGHRHRG